MSLYKGYISANGKAATEKFKNEKNFRTLAETKRLKSYAGVLEDDTVMIDIDDSHEADLMMAIVDGEELKCRVVATNRGKHFLFKSSDITKNQQHTKLAVGLTADIKVGSRPSYEILKINGVERTIEWDINEGEEYQQLPKWLLPIKSAPDFKILGDGDGRNSTLFSYILTMQTNGFADDDIRDCIRIINRHVLLFPLPDDEIDTILREEAFQTPVFFEKRDFLFDKFAIWLTEKHHIVRIMNQLHLYEKGVYVPGDDVIESVMLTHISRLRKLQRKEVIDYLQHTAPVITGNNNHEDYIAFNNGILNWRTGELSDFTPDIILTGRIPHDYDPGAYSEIVDRAFEEWSCHDPEIRSLLEECIGYCFFRKNTLQKSFILMGRRANGKSTFLNCVRAVLGNGNVSALDLSELGDRFSTAMLFGKLANVGDDISDDFLRGTQAAIFKKIVTGEEIKAERKGQDPFSFKPTTKLLFSTNNMPRIRDRTGAVLRRLIIIPFDADFINRKNDMHILDDLTTPEAIRYMVLLGVRGLQRIMRNGGFTQSVRINDELKRYEEENDPLIGFLADHTVSDFLHEGVSDVYTQYKMYCTENGQSPMSQKSFGTEIRSRLGLVGKQKKINGKVYRIYENEEKVTDGNAR